MTGTGRYPPVSLLLLIYPLVGLISKISNSIINYHQLALSVQPLSQCPTLCDPMDCSKPGFPVLHQLLDFRPIQT